MRWIARKLLNYLYPYQEGMIKETERKKLMRDLQKVDKFQEYLKRNIQTNVKYIALQATPDQVDFYRGCIYSNQVLLTSIKGSIIKTKDDYAVTSRQV